MNPYRSFQDVNGHQGHPIAGAPQIYTAVYSGVSVYEFEINGVAVMRRRSDSWLNATQILKVAGVDKGKRTKVLEKEILTGEHEKVQGGYGKYQGTWINYERGREFCRQYGVEELLRPLLEYDTSNDGKTPTGNAVDTPTKEQAMAANRKRFYTTLDGRQASQGANGTFFSNISTTASNAIAAMNKVARMNSPAPRPTSAAQRSGNAPQRSSQPMMGSQGSFREASQQSRPSLASERSFSAAPAQDSAYGTQGQFSGEQQVDGTNDEPPRKRMRPMSRQQSFTQPNGAPDLSMRDATPTEPNESFVYQQASQQQQLLTHDGEVPTAMPPLPPPSDKRAEEKQGMLLDLFADLGRTDFTNHPAIQRLSGADLDMPLDQSANTALHWAATLARVSLMRLLIAKGASIYRGNIAGQTPLMAAVQVNNSLDHSCFPDLLEILAPLIEVRDATGRTILHHIAVSCGIKGRAASSKYYLEALLEFLVRSTSAVPGPPMETGLSKPIGLMRFMSEMVNVRDNLGNTALNLVARIGNRSIIQQLLEVQADPAIPNYKGLSAIDFGVGIDVDRNRANAQAMGPPGSQPIESPTRNGKAPISRVDETNSHLLPALTTSLNNLQSQHAAEMRLKTDSFDRANAQIRDLAAQHAQLGAALSQLQNRVKNRSERAVRTLNLRRSIEESKHRLSHQGVNLNAVTGPRGSPLKPGDVEKLDGLEIPATSVASNSQGGGHVNGDSSMANLTTLIDPMQLPDVPTLRARMAGYAENNDRLKGKAKYLKGRSAELETMYRKVIALCTGVEEGRVEENLAALVQAVESENVPPGADAEVGRVKEFLRKVEGVGLATPTT
ncbi:hypothetical protein NA57DRAFT_48321 [Rhizodiscina lignyota]|uniref:HTH APSES-type domain-containing protein n=1 Tax=Rhizodiscina lignyota TaxID=1504668 RepID=A0A9P4I7T4_9PEZI|nr:hypothetical protein NA57DRAFT_48321 [Rhizodiscina lignyota]